MRDRRLTTISAGLYNALAPRCGYIGLQFIGICGRSLPGAAREGEGMVQFTRRNFVSSVGAAVVAPAAAVAIAPEGTAPARENSAPAAPDAPDASLSIYSSMPPKRGSSKPRASA